MSDFLGSLRVLLEADTGNFTAALTDAARNVSSAQANINRSLASIESSFKNLSSTLEDFLSVAGIVAFTRNVIEMADQFEIVGKRIGFTGSSLAAMKTVLQQNGASIEDFGVAINKMNENIGLAARGGQEQIKVFDQLGLSVTALKKLTPEQQFYAIAQAMADVKNQSELTQTSMGLFGKTGSNLIGTLKEMGFNVQEFVQHEKEMGHYIDDATISQIQKFENQWTQTINGIKFAMANSLGVIGDYFYYLGVGVSTILNIPSEAQAAGRQLGAAAGLIPNKKLPGIPYYSERPQTVSQATRVSGYTLDSKGNLIPPNPAAGNNKDLPSKEAMAAMQAYKEKVRDINQQIFDLANNEDKATAEAEKIALAAGMIKIDHGLVEIPAQAREKFDELNASLHELYDRQEAKKVITDSKTALDKYNDSIGEYTRLLQEGYLTTQQFDKAQAHAKETMDKSDQDIKDSNSAFKQFGLTMSSSLESAISQGKSLRDVLHGIADDIYKMFIRLEVTNPLSQWMQSNFSGSGGLLSSLGNLFNGSAGQIVYSSPNAVGPFPQRATGGSVTGGMLYKVNEFDDEFFRPNSSGSIIPLAPGGGGGRGGNTYHIDARGADAGAVQRIEGALMRLAGPGVVEQRVINAQQRGQIG